jgi:anaerobic magnesium-protoporphyrin IX monomethyl ester cyclase
MSDKQARYDLIDVIRVNDDPIALPDDADMADKKHMDMMKAIAPYTKSKPQKNLTPLYVDYKTRNTKLELVLAPHWAPEFPPFNLARLSSVAKSAGYETHLTDVNVIAYNKYINDWLPNDKVPFLLWDASANWHWVGENYWKDIHHIIQETLDESIADILSRDPDVVGFSMYYISEEATKYMCRKIKEHDSNIKIIVGGSNIMTPHFQPDHELYDYAVKGEGEAILLEILDEIENGASHQETQVVSQAIDQRLNINGMPMPDYTSLDFSLYRVPNGVNTEFSRGCTAKCTFCEETHFWKYRQRQAVDLIDEIEWLYYNKGTDVIWFIDSLVNGNIKELRAFCKAVIAKGLKIHWTGYARSDGKMDLEYFRDLAASGCLMLNYGCESGSQRVLDDMHKGVTVAEMEQNFRDGKATGVWASTNWIVGFPTETHNEFTHTMQFMWRNINNNINNIAAGVGMSVGKATVVGQNPHRFNVAYYNYSGHWITKDLDMSGIHVMHRVKNIHIFLDLIVPLADQYVAYPVRSKLPLEHYKVTFDDPECANHIEFQDFDYDIIETGESAFADNLVNEMFALFRTLWRIRGGFQMEVYFDPDRDDREFGNQYGGNDYTAVYKFEITKDGEWSADFDVDFVQKISHDAEEQQMPDRQGVFYLQEDSKLGTNAAIRARKLAKPYWGEDGRTQEDFWHVLNEEQQLNDTIDYTFKDRYKLTGKW